MASSLAIPSDIGRRLESADERLREPAPYRFAAVLGLLAESEGPDPRLVLIERSGTLRSHAGQLAFPGGKPEPEDRDLVATALRETHEEVSLAPERVSILGRLDPVPTPTGYLIVPFVGTLAGPLDAVADGDEAVRVLSPRLSTLTASYRSAGWRKFRGIDYELHEFGFDDPPLWGATARMAFDLLSRLGWERPA